MLLLLLACAPEGAPQPGARAPMGATSRRETIEGADLIHGDWWIEPGVGDIFGYVADGAGDVNADGFDDIVITDPSYSSSAGYIYLYLGSSDGPSTSPDWSTYASDNYYTGYAASGIGDVDGDGFGDLAFGEPGYSKGYVQVWYGSATGPATSTTITGASSYDAIGYQLAGGDVNGDGFADLAVGSYAATSSDYGAVNLYLGSATGIATSAAWTVSGTTSKEYVGWGVSVGDVNGDGYADLGYTAPGRDDGQTNEGGVFIHFGSGAGLAATPDWSWSADTTSEALGTALDLRGDFDANGFSDVAVSAIAFNGGETDEGGVRLFGGGPSGPAPSPSWTWESDLASCYAGERVRAIGDADGDGYDELAVSSADCNEGDGAVWIFPGSYAGLDDGSTLGDGAAVGSWGEAIGAAGDVDGDGDDELLVGVSSYGGYGRVWMFEGRPTGLAASTGIGDLELELTGLGARVANAGDTDDNGYEDLLIGSEDRLWLYLVTADGIDASPSWNTACTCIELADECWAVGDFDGDGHSDLAVGNYLDDDVETDEGELLVFMGNISGLASTAAVTVHGGQADAGLGNAIASAGDVNGDGYEDLVVGASTLDVESLDEGGVYVFLGGPSGIDPSAFTFRTLGQDSAAFGASVAGGDVDGDGFGDVLVAADRYDDRYNEEGAVFLYRGSAAGIDTSPDVVVKGGATYAYFGATLTTIGDVDDDGSIDVGVQSSSGDGSFNVYTGLGAGDLASSWAGEVTNGASSHGGDVDADGFGDLLLGSSTWDNGASDAGSAVLYLGAAAGLGTSGVAIEGDYADAECGTSVALIDLDLDGYADRVVGCPGYGDGVIAIMYGGPVDLDGDGAVSPADCDDADPTRSPTAEEACDGIDNNCDGNVDEVLPAWFRDADGDGAGDPTRSLSSCLPPSGYVPDGDDCDDSNAAISPSAAEGCDDVDNNCDGAVDEEGGGPWYPDADGDGEGALLASSTACAMPEGYSGDATDCDDEDAANFPGNEETCDGRDNNCDGDVDEGGGSLWFLDADGDGAGSEVAGVGCEGPAGSVDNNADCDDTNTSIGPEALEVCGGGDEDCDGLVDEDAADAIVYYLDGDGDGFPGGDALHACEVPADGSPTANDCDDLQPTVNPGAVEACNEVDDNCDGAVDEAGGTAWYEDADGDGVGGAVSVTACLGPEGYVAETGDCDDISAVVAPGATESCNGIDDNCDGAVDEAGGTTWYEDADGDGIGGATSVTACSAPEGHVANTGDCGDTDAAVNPSAAESCNAVDDNCDGAVDEAGGSTWYADADADGAGGEVATIACVAPEGYVAVSGDCDDADASVVEGGPWYADADGDGFGTDSTSASCVAPEGYVAVPGDCDDNNRDTWPGAPERWYDGVDEACDGGSDYDRDGDGDDADEWGGTDCDDGDASVNPSAADEPYDGVVSDCDPADEYDVDRDGFAAVVADGDDCDDLAAGVNPGAKETWYDGTDQDCDGNDDDRDRDGFAHDADCDDTDASVQLCKVVEPDGCGCSSGPPPSLAALLALLALRRRRGSDGFKQDRRQLVQ